LLITAAGTPRHSEVCRSCRGRPARYEMLTAPRPKVTKSVVPSRPRNAFPAATKATPRNAPWWTSPPSSTLWRRRSPRAATTSSHDQRAAATVQSRITSNATTSLGGSLIAKVDREGLALIRDRRAGYPCTTCARLAEGPRPRCGSCAAKHVGHEPFRRSSSRRLHPSRPTVCCSDARGPGSARRSLWRYEVDWDAVPATAHGRVEPTARTTVPDHRPCRESGPGGLAQQLIITPVMCVTLIFEVSGAHPLRAARRDPAHRLLKTLPGWTRPTAPAACPACCSAPAANDIRPTRSTTWRTWSQCRGRKAAGCGRGVRAALARSTSTTCREPRAPRRGPGARDTPLVPVEQHWPTCWPPSARPRRWVRWRGANGTVGPRRLDVPSPTSAAVVRTPAMDATAVRAVDLAGPERPRPAVPRLRSAVRSPRATPSDYRVDVVAPPPSFAYHDRCPSSEGARPGARWSGPNGGTTT